MNLLDFIKTRMNRAARPDDTGRSPYDPKHYSNWHKNPEGKDYVEPQTVDYTPLFPEAAKYGPLAPNEAPQPLDYTPTHKKPKSEVIPISTVEDLTTSPKYQRANKDINTLATTRDYLIQNNPELSEEDITAIVKDLERQQRERVVYESRPRLTTLKASDAPPLKREAITNPQRMMGGR